MTEKKCPADPECNGACEFNGIPYPKETCDTYMKWQKQQENKQHLIPKEPSEDVYPPKNEFEGVELEPSVNMWQVIYRTKNWNKTEQISFTLFFIADTVEELVEKIEKYLELLKWPLYDKNNNCLVNYRRIPFITFTEE